MKKKEKQRLEEMSNEDLQKRLNDINLEIMKFNASRVGGGKAIKVPASSRGNINYGMFKELRKEKARILTIMRKRRG